MRPTTRYNQRLSHDPGETSGEFVVLRLSMEPTGDDSLHLELTKMAEDQLREEVRVRQERTLRAAFFVAPALALLMGQLFLPRCWFMLLGVPVVAAMWGAQFKGSEDRFHALFWGNVVAIGAYILMERLGAVVPAF